MRGTVKGVIDGLNEILIQFNDAFQVERGDIVEVELPKEKRSKDSNSFYWAMVAKLAKKLNTSAEAIYKHHIREMSIYNCMLIETKAVDDFTKRWCSHHLGRFVSTRQSQQEGKTIVLAYYGSSDFNKIEMYRLIENLKQDLKSQGIEYDQEEAERLVRAWHG